MCTEPSCTDTCMALLRGRSLLWLSPAVEDLPHKDGKLLRPGVVWFNEVSEGTGARGSHSVTYSHTDMHTCHSQ